MLKKTLKKQGGFTLLELLIVIVIIGILAVLIIPNITSAPKKARDTKRVTETRAIQKALEEYYTEKSAYPTTANLASELTTGTPPFMKSIPKDPKTNAAYTYTSDGTTYTIKACLENTGAALSDTVVSDTTTCGANGKAINLVNNN